MTLPVEQGSTAAPACPFDFDYLSKEYAETIYDVVDEHRACPALQGSAYGGYTVITSYDEVLAATNDAEHFSSAAGVTIPVITNATPPATMDPPEHGLYRRIVQPNYTTGSVRQFEPTIRQVIVEHIEAVRPLGHTDLVTTLAGPVPPIVIAISLGIAPEYWPVIGATTQKVLDATYAEDYPALRAAIGEVDRFIEGQIELKRGSGDSDVISTLLNASIEGQPLDDADLIAMVRLVIAAGHETTVHGIGTLIKHLLDRPKVRERALADPAYLDRVLDESLRLEAPVFGMARHVKEPVTLGAHQYQVGEAVLVSMGSANRDPAQFERPGEFDADRDNLRRQVAFGYGRHRCLGEWLARAEMRITVEELFTRLEGLHWAEDATHETVVGIARGPKSLRVAW